MKKEIKEKTTIEKLWDYYDENFYGYLLIDKPWGKEWYYGNFRNFIEKLLLTKKG